MSNEITGALFKQMVLHGAAAITAQKQAINDLNVFPVPDGDTGTNMSMTIATAAEALRKSSPASVGQASSVTASALLQGARGNSGVILSLLFRGLSKSLKGMETADAAAFAAAHGVYLVRKGHRTLAAAPDGRLAVNTTGNDGMAKGGSGDILTGLLTGLLAQGMEPFSACCAAVWLHGRAGDLAAEEKGRRGMTPLDIIEMLPYALKEVE